MSEMNLQQMFETARAHHQAGRLGEALRLYQQVLNQDPAHADTVHLCGIIELQQSHNDGAIKLIEHAIRLNPNAAHYYCNIGQAYLNVGRVPDAVNALNRALSIRPNYPDALNNMGNALRTAGDGEAAIGAYRKALALDKGFVEAHTNLAELLREKGLLDEALAHCRAALALRPNSLEAYNHMGNALRDKGQFDEAMSSYRQALLIRQDAPEVHNNVGTVRRAQGNLEQAILAYQHALELRPDFASAQNNLAVALRDQGKLTESLTAQQRALDMQPNWPLAIYNQGLTHLLLGDFENGWAGYEHRTRVPELAASVRRVDGSAWEGQEVAGKRVYVHAEQGLGDLIQFVRYVPMLAERGAKIALQCPVPLLRLFQCVGGVEALVSSGLPPNGFDLQCSLLSLPRLFQTRLDNIPSDVPYLLADSDLSDRWRHRISGGKLKVGLVWAGRPQHPNDRNRSMGLSMLEPLAQVPEATFFSLQKGPAASQAGEQKSLRLVELTNELTDMADTAAAVSNLDLVLTVDTAVAHLAGAMGRPVWVLLPFVPDWRWMMERTDSPWYPTMRLFRQPALGDWQSVIQNVASELQALVTS